MTVSSPRKQVEICTIVREIIQTSTHGKLQKRAIAFLENTARLAKAHCFAAVACINCLMTQHVALSVCVFRVRGGLEAERAERVKCKQEDMERDRRNFEAMQVRLQLQ